MNKTIEKPEVVEELEVVEVKVEKPEVVKFNDKLNDKFNDKLNAKLDVKPVEQLLVRGPHTFRKVVVNHLNGDVTTNMELVKLVLSVAKLTKCFATGESIGLKTNMGRRIPVTYKMIDSAQTTVSTGYRVSDYRNCILSIIGSPTANLKVFIKGAVSTKGAEYNSAPDFTVRSSARNEDSNWDFIEVVDLQDGTAIDGDTGVNLSGDIIRLLEVNINSLDWLCVHSTGIVTGTVTVVGVFTTNE